jgi:AcrR family transcriptional regulator
MTATISSKPSKNLVARRTDRVRRELAAAAAQLFEENGYDATTVEDIAAAVEVSPRTFYRLFPTKGDVIIGMVRTRWSDVVTELGERPADEPLVTSLEAVLVAKVEEVDPKALRSFEELLARNTQLRARWLEETRRNQDLLAEVLARRMSLVPESLQIQLVAAAILTTLRTSLEVWSASSSDFGAASTLREAMAMLAPMFDESLRMQPLQRRTSRAEKRVVHFSAGESRL